MRGCVCLGQFLGHARIKQSPRSGMCMDGGTGGRQYIETESQKKLRTRGKKKAKSRPIEGERNESNARDCLLGPSAIADLRTFAFAVVRRDLCSHEQFLHVGPCMQLVGSPAPKSTAEPNQSHPTTPSLGSLTTDLIVLRASHPLTVAQSKFEKASDPPLLDRPSCVLTNLLVKRDEATVRCCRPALQSLSAHDAPFLFLADL